MLVVYSTPKSLIMKKALIILPALLFCFTQLQSQEPLFDTTKLWSHLSITPSWGGPPPHAWATDFHKVEGNTVINSVSYMNLMTTIDQNLTNWNLQGYVREDGSGKVYYRAIQDSTERLIYDFGLELGDTIILNHLSSFPYIVTNVDSVLLNNNFRKRITLNTYETWVEGVGSQMGLMCSGYSELVGVNHYMLCYFENGSLIYSNPNYSLCYYNTVDIEDREFQDAWISIHPNPVVSTSTFRISGDLDVKGSLLEVYSLTGSLLKSYNIEENEIQLHASDFESGIYFYRLITVDGLGRSGKFVVR